MFYDDLHEHFRMLRDDVRTDGYRRAIDEVVGENSVVLDLGCGTGILSVFASRAGAARVYAIECAAIGRLAEAIFAANATPVVLLRGKADEVSIPERINVLVSEWMGLFLFREKMFEAVVSMRDRVLAEDGVMLPSRVRLFAALASSPYLCEERDYFAARPHGVSYAPAADWLATRAFSRAFEPSELCSEAALLASLDMLTCSAALPSMDATFKIAQAAELHAICGWFDAQLSPSHAFDTGPSSPLTHWEQMCFPFREPLRVEVGDTVSISIRALRIGKDAAPSWQWTVTHRNKKFVHDDFMHKLHLPVA